MKVRLIFLPLLFLELSFSAVAVAAPELVYISSLKATLLAQPQFKSPVISQLKKGDQVSVINQKGVWLNVQTADQKTGWLSKFLTKSTPPNDRITVLSGDEKNPLKDVRRRTSAITTAAAARGLADVAKGTKEDLYKSDSEAVNYMESFNIPSRELKAFSAAILEGDKE